MYKYLPFRPKRVLGRLFVTLHDSKITEILNHPEDYIDNRQYISWERYFTALLQDKTLKDPIKKYSKSSLSTFYTGENAKKILQVMPKEIRELI